MLRCLWKIKVPTRILSFGRRLFWNIMATKDQLLNRGWLNIEMTYVFYDQEEENLKHLLFEFLVSLLVWEMLGV